MYRKLIKKNVFILVKNGGDRMDIAEIIAYIVFVIMGSMCGIMLLWFFQELKILIKGENKNEEV